MKNKRSWWQRSRVWGKLRDTFAVFGTGTTIGLEAGGVEGLWSYIVAGATLGGTLLGIWMSDENNNGIVDIFENGEEGEVTVTETTKIEVNKKPIE